MTPIEDTGSNKASCVWPIQSSINVNERNADKTGFDFMQPCWLIGDW